MRFLLTCAAYLVAAPAPALTGPLPLDGTADYQLGGDYPPPDGVTIIARDSTDSPAPGLYNICYVNGFQTQPGAEWPQDLLVPGPDGRPLADPDWPDEFLLDISTQSRRAANLDLVLPAIRRCAAAGFDAVEFDNLDSYTRSGGYLGMKDALAFARLLTHAARKLGLPAGQKNTAELGSLGRDTAGFAFAVVEECDRWQECAAFTNVYGRDQVIDIEYVDDIRTEFDAICADPDRPALTILRDRMLLVAGSRGYHFETCNVAQ